MTDCSLNPDKMLWPAKLKRLVKRLLDERAIPFLGAGVSYNAQLPNGSKPARTQSMVNRLKRHLERVRSGGFPSEKRMARFFNKELSTQSLADLCEIYLWSCGEDRFVELVCDVLLIHQFTRLSPTHAHRFIAFLARENLVSEVITTNYDTCLEKAYKETVSHREIRSKDLDKMALSIATLNGYRKYGGKGKASLNNRDYPCLRVYKINGCAKESLGGDPSGEIKDILLTERQLQEWGERGWARDLFRDRIRSRCLVFSGFGSEEPQVRHTALRVVEEFSSEHSSCPWEMENAPFIVYYDKLSFCQCQILQAYIQANSACKKKDFKCWQVFGREDDIVFFQDGSDAGGQKLKGLEADLFWKRVFQFTFWELLRLYCQPNKPAYELLSAAVAPSRVLFKQMLEWLRPEDKPFGRFPELLDFDETGHLHLSRWIWCIRYGIPEPNPGWYPSLFNRPVLLPFFFLALYLLSGKPDDWADLLERVSENNSVLFVDVSKNISSTSNSAVILSHSERAFAVESNIVVQKNVLVQILLDRLPFGGSRIYKKKIRLSTNNPEKSGAEKDMSIKMVSVYQISLLEMLRGDGWAANSIGQVKRNFRNALLAPSNLVRARKPSIRKRAKPVRD